MTTTLGTGYPVLTAFLKVLGVLFAAVVITGLVIAAATEFGASAEQQAYISGAGAAYSSVVAVWYLGLLGGGSA